MKRRIVLHGKEFEIDAQYISYDRDTLDVPRVGEMWNRVEVARGARVTIEGVTGDGTEIDGAYRLIRLREDGAIEVEPWSDRDRVGGGQG